MRRATAWGVVVGVLAVWTATPSAAQADGFWASIAAGSAGASAPSDYTEFWFDSPHAPPIAVTQLTGTTAQAITGGGTTFFSPAGTPVLLPTSNGYATLTNLDVANGSGGLPRFAGEIRPRAAPITAQPVPPNSNKLSVGLGDAGSDGSRVLTVGVTDPNGNPLGNGQVTLPNGGWWVIGIGPGEKDSSPPPTTDPVGGGDWRHWRHWRRRRRPHNRSARRRHWQQYRWRRRPARDAGARERGPARAGRGDLRRLSKTEAGPADLSARHDRIPAEAHSVARSGLRAFASSRLAASRSLRRRARHLPRPTTGYSWPAC